MDRAALIILGCQQLVFAEEVITHGASVRGRVCRSPVQVQVSPGQRRSQRHPDLVGQQKCTQQRAGQERDDHDRNSENRRGTEGDRCRRKLVRHVEQVRPRERRSD